MPLIRSHGLLLFLLLLLPLLVVASTGATLDPSELIDELSRSSFPPGFIFGTATSAYQTEGAAAEGGRGPSIWDTYTHMHPEKIADRSTGDVAIDSYHRYKDDIRILKDLGADAFRLSFSWSRILPKGTLRGGVNREGIQHYNNVINELLSKGLQPFVTLFHWDLPQALEDEYHGFLSPRVVIDYRDYVDLCFKEFGDRVKNWITLNEPWSFAQRGYASGIFAPCRCSPYDGVCFGGDSSREPYIVMHHLLLCHASAVKLYREKYQAAQKGQIGVTLVTNWFVPYSKTKYNVEAAERALDFMFGWFMDPISSGDYPFTMRALVGDRLPQFTAAQSEMLKRSFDFLGLNYYTSNYAKSISLLSKVNASYNTDIRVSESGFRKGVALGPQASGSDWLFDYPQGLRDLLLYVKEKYSNPTIYITENGIDDFRNASQPLEEALKDDARIRYHRGHLTSVKEALSKGVNVKGYFAWALFDDFEWDAGFTVGFGLYYVDHKNDLKRIPKKSVFWLREFLKK